MATKRFLDKYDLSNQEREFVRRSHGVSIWWLSISFASSFVFIMMLTYFVVPQDTVVVMTGMGGILATLAAFALFYVIRQREVITNTEFQNALLAGAARLNTDFCLVAKYDGSIVYIDPEFAKKFPQLNHNANIRHLDSLVEHMPEGDRERLLDALAEGKPTQVALESMAMDTGSKTLTLALDPIGIYAQSGDKKRLMLAVDPLPRPSGYFFIRAQKTDNAPTYRNILKDFPIGYFVLDTQHKMVECNSRFATMLGHNMETLTTNDWTLDRFLPHHEEARALLSSKGDRQQTVILQDKEGYEFPVTICLHTIKNRTGEIIEYHGLVVEIVESEDENELRTAIRDLVDWLKYSPVATAVLDVNGEIIRGNDAFSRLMERMHIKDDTVTHLTDLVIDDEREQVSHFMEELFQGRSTGSEKPLDVRLNYTDSELRASLYISRMAVQPGMKSGYVVHLIDTTELKNLELRFVHSQKMQAVGQLAGGIAHDFNNLLTAMMGFCDLLLMRHPAGDQSFADIMQIKQNANRAANLVRQLLAFSRKQTLQPKVISITDVLADLSNLIGRLIGENITLEMVHGRDLGLVRVDQGQLEQVIINLAVNARDAMESGGTLTIRTQNIKIDKDHPINPDMIAPAEDDTIENGDYVLLEISDTGCGIDKETLGKIFEPFFSTKEIGSGTGLGLSTVYGIIKQTDGYIYVSSTPGKGSTFSIFLRRSEKTDSKKKSATKEAAEHSVALEDLTGKGRILLVEDETPVRTFSASALMNKGYTVLEADSGQRGIEIMKEKGDEIDLIISDVIMPGITGTAMVEEVRKIYPDMPVIFISGYAEDVFNDTEMQDQPFHFLPKPYTLKQLASKVKEVMGGGK